ncbi:hypothetical protein F511_27825 [Dorcoceras hygrometricum]|uniref:Uncharacterized protein n=1 Tax=Dorcoceras hygrometricum TaxID=472368 RepID=A0A2Z7BYU6_9LAMI|nr:hypothetical protein F511_27825 [Dorcoceras hygrometricum]
MGKTKEYNYYMKKSNKGSSCMNRFSRNTTRGAWTLEVPSRETQFSLKFGLEVPSWEKQFCLKIGLFKWKDFLDAKKYSQYFGPSKIQDWDDSAAEEAFNHAKRRFFARCGGSQPHRAEEDAEDDDESMMDPDLYIDEIDWDDDGQVDPDLFNELESAKLLRNYDNVEYHADPDPIQIQDIKPTGWDIEVESLSQSNVLTGLIVGS